MGDSKSSNGEAVKKLSHVIWTREEYGTDIPVIDEEHQVLFNYLNGLLDMKDNQSKCMEVQIACLISCY
tara:strand:- start:264 stop:470 length:207 start_codon:yes stop_codon:yes gene_type:complete